ncbi:MAG: PAS domain S-box protein [Haloarculaceae archaeon]
MSPGSVKQMRVLVVDDNADLVDVVAEFLEREHDGITAVTATSADGALDRLQAESVDCVVSDYDMPETNGLELLRDVRDRETDLPFVLFTGKGSEEIASEAISAGVTEYLQKGTATEQYTVLANRVERAVSEHRARTRQAETERRFATLIENLPGMAYRCRNEPGWPMEFVSDGCEELTGYTAGEIESGAINWGEEILHPDDREDMWDAVQQVLNGEETFQVTYRIRRADGETRWCWERGQLVTDKQNDEILEGFITDITPRKRREQELQAEREFTESALNALEDMFFVIDPATEKLIRWNDRVPEKTGYTESELATMEGTEIIAADDRDRAREAMATAMTAGTVVIETEIVSATGEHIPYEFRGTVVSDEDDDQRGIATVGRDVSEQREREQTLERYRTLVENVGDPMYVLDTDGTIEMINRAMSDHLGYDREQLVGEPASTFLLGEDSGRGNKIIASLIESDETEWETWEMQVETRDGTVTSHENKVAILTDDDGTFVGSVGVVRDITERKQREEELERYETVVQAVGDPVYALDDDGVITFVNDAAEAMTGYDADTLVGSHIGTILADDGVDIGNKQIGELLDDPDRRATTFEVTVETSDGDQIPSEVHIALLPTPEETFHGTAGIIRDIEQRKEREERLEQFASVVSHDLRGPLNVILGRVDLARKDVDSDELDAIAKAATRMEELIEDLLTLARQGQTIGDSTQVSLSGVAEDAWQSIETPPATLDNRATLSVEADPDRLQELLENLFRNGVEHSATDSRPQADDGVEQAGKNVRIAIGHLDDADGFYVADDGPGIPEDERNAVFDHGYTTNEHGTGFGLSIVERIADAHGWSVTVTESEDGGARFEIRTG